MSTTPSHNSPEKLEIPIPDKPPTYQVETTGSRWKDLWVAFTRVKEDDLSTIERIPCARNSLMSGIATGAGVGVIRALSATCNWAVGSFMLVGAGTWHICQARRTEEKKKVEKIMETLPKRFVKKKNPDGADASSAADAAAP
ncbi:hypothetical protein HWV62_40132 [Athelia sp. TMB]|nr:hypothetical protein HWV62_40132 [Athelia sp. TMB]